METDGQWGFFGLFMGWTLWAVYGMYPVTSCPAKQSRKRAGGSKIASPLLARCRASQLCSSSATCTTGFGCKRPLSGLGVSLGC